MHMQGIFGCFQKYTSHTFAYKSYFAQIQKSEWCGAIIDIRSYEPIFVLAEKYRTSKTTLKNVLRDFFEGGFIVDYVFKMTENYIS